MHSITVNDSQVIIQIHAYILYSINILINQLFSFFECVTNGVLLQTKRNGHLTIQCVIDFWGCVLSCLVPFFLVKW